MDNLIRRLEVVPRLSQQIQRWDIYLNRVSQCPLLGTKVDLVLSMIHLYVLTITTIGMSRYEALLAMNNYC